MKKKIIFFIRHFNDLDHISPIIWSLLKTKKIEAIIFFTDPFNEKFFKKNFRTIILKKYGAKLVGFSDSNYRFKFLLPYIGSLFRLDNNFLNINIISSKIGGIILYLFFKKKFQDEFIKKKSFELINDNYSILVFDHMVNDLRKEIIKYSKNKKCINIALPHGAVLYSYKKKWLNKFKKKSALSLKIFDKVIFPNGIDKFYGIEKKILKEKFLKLGSPRFTIPWINVLKNNFSKKMQKERKKINILFLVEKEFNFYQNRKHIISDIKKQTQILQFLKKQKNFSLKIKLNTRSITQSQLYRLEKFYNENISKDETNNLIFWSDIVICGGGTSIILQSIATKVPTICCTFLHPEHKFFYKNFGYPKEVKNFQEFAKFILGKNFLKVKSERKRLNFLKKIVMINQNPFKLYNNFFLNLKK